MNDLLNWIENEAARGLSEGDTVAALTAIKWRIKDSPPIAKTIGTEPQTAPEPTVWLVEWPESDTVPVRWWNPAHGWMRDANKALHFARKADADCYLSTMRIGETLKVTEHKFVSQSHSHAVNAEDRT